MVRKIKELQVSLRSRNSNDLLTDFTINQSWFIKNVLSENRGSGVPDWFREFFLQNSIGTVLLWVLVWLSSGLGLLIGIGFAFLNTNTAVKIAVIPIVIAITYIILVLLSEIFATFKFANHLIVVNINLLGSKDLGVMIRTSYIMVTRKIQFLLIAILLLLYGVFSDYIDNLFVNVISIPVIAFLAIFDNAFEYLNFLPNFFLNILALSAAFVSVIIATASVYLYIKFCKLLIRIKIPEDFQPRNILEFPVDEKIQTSYFSWRKL
ncbi:MAG: hypothetical protein ACXADA_06240 [Candidatus Hodarchaeales archaeon]